MGWYIRSVTPLAAAGDVQLRFSLRHADAAVVVFSVIVWALCVAAAVTWRDTPVISAIAIAYVIWTLFYIDAVFSFPTLGLFRLNAAVIAVGIAGLLPRTPTPTQPHSPPARTTPHRGRSRV